MPTRRIALVILVAAGLGGVAACGEGTGRGAGETTTSGTGGTACYQYRSECSCTCGGDVVTGLMAGEASCADLVGIPCGDAGADVNDGGDGGTGAVYASCTTTAIMCE